MATVARRCTRPVREPTAGRRPPSEADDPTTVAHAHGLAQTAAITTKTHWWAWISRSGGAPGTPSRMGTRSPACLPRCLVLSGGFTVDDGHHRHLDQQARRLGFADLRACLHALLDDGWSIPRLATHLDTTQAAIRRAIADHQLQQLPRRQRLALTRQHAAQQRATDRVAELGFPNPAGLSGGPAGHPGMDAR